MLLVMRQASTDANGYASAQSETYDTMKLAALVALGLSAIVLGFARAELSKILGSLRNDILEQLHLDSAQLLAWMLMSVILLRV